MLEVMIAITNINDAQLNNLLKLKKSNNNTQVDDAIVSRLSDLYNPSTSYDEDVELIKSSLNL